MKNRRCLGWIMAVLLCFLCLRPLAAGPESLFFVAVNDTVPLSLPGSNAPFYQNGSLYVPQNAFGVSGLGVTPSYNVASQTMVLFSREQRLIFQLDTGKVTDENDQRHGSGAVVRGGVVYLPVMMCVSHFGLSATYLTNNKGYRILRFTTGSEIYDDALFLQKSEKLIDYRAQQYSSEQPKPEQPQTKPPAPPGPSQETPPPPEEKKSPTVYLAVEGADTMENAGAVLDGKGIRGTFFLTCEEIQQDPALVQKLFAQGRSVGLTVPDGEDPQESLHRANEALRLLVGQKTLLALLTGSQSRQVSGYFVILRERAVSAKIAAAKESGSCLILCRGNCRDAVNTLSTADAKYRALRETAPFG